MRFSFCSIMFNHFLDVFDFVIPFLKSAQQKGKVVINICHNSMKTILEQVPAKINLLLF